MPHGSAQGPRGDGAASADERWVAGRFTSGDGWLSWLEAVRAGSPVFGPGALGVTPERVILRGSQRTWLGVREDAEVSIPRSDLTDAALVGRALEFEYRRPLRRKAHVTFTARDGAEMAAALAGLAADHNPRFQRRWSELRSFNDRLDALSRGSPLTLAIIAVNLAIYLAMAVGERRLGGFDGPFLVNWGANYGPLTMSGQWWRLVSALFLHMNLLHVGLNMWALFGVGTLTERLFGRWPFAVLYLGAGVLASLSSVAWNSEALSVGASGAIFGVFGAFLACLTRYRHNSIPRAVVRVHWLSTLAFVAFSLFNGMTKVGIDNAAHVGGLFGGYVLGLILMRPVGAAARERVPLARISSALGIVGAGFLCLCAMLHGFRVPLTPPDQYMRANAWYSTGETENLAAWQQLALQYQEGTISQAALAAIVKVKILPFWKQSAARLGAQRPHVPVAQQPFADALMNFVEQREQWAQAIADEADGSVLTKHMLDTDAAVARSERLRWRAALDGRPHALSGSAWVLAVRRAFSGPARGCVHYPWDIPPGPKDRADDGPAQRAAAQCRAQALFLEGRYVALDAWMTQAARSIGDMNDGESTFRAITRGLEILFEYGGVGIQDLLARTSDWRRAVRDPQFADLVECDVYSSWAWEARGHGTANQVTQQGWLLFYHRNAIAQAALDDLAQAAQIRPEWYTTAIDLALDRDQPLPELQKIFDAGVKVTRDYLPLYSKMLRALQPRWRGSSDEVGPFIRDQSLGQEGGDLAMYARLYWDYADLEEDDRGIFSDTLATWSTMKKGFRVLEQRYPGSDYILNAYARFACAAEDAGEYGQLRAQIKTRPSATGWSKTTTMADCDRWLAGKLHE